MTGIKTQWMGDEESYLATTSKAIGRRIDDEQHELFVVCDPAEALQQQFEHHTPEFITLHEIGLDGSLHLLRAVARATRRKVQQLVVRRQGFGLPLATLQFVELPGPANAPLVRIYSTQVEVADESQRIELAKVLLGHSRLGVFLVGRGAPAQNTARLQPLSDAMYDTTWRNRHLMWLPIGPDAATGAPNSLGGRRSVVQMHSAPHSADLAHAWPMISSVWDQLRAGGPVTLAHFTPSPAPPPPLPAPAAAAPAARPPLPMRPMPPTQPMPMDAEPINTAMWQDYVRELAAIPGMLSCCVFERETQRPIAHAGGRPGAATLAARGSALFDSLCSTAQALGLAAGQPDLALTLAEHHVLLHPFERHPRLLLHAVLDAHLANLTLVRMKLHRLDPGEFGPLHD
ncbi:MAG: hypothetical protein HY855_02585 [Burkholderiales bacterium]|nr:hypothetical protein [Burkholderiales bacterium]